MIGLSPLSPGHRSTFQRTAVRPSTGSYPRFSLPRDSSPGFASSARDSNRPVRTRLRCGSLPSLTSPRASDSLAHSTKGTPSHRIGAPTARGRTVSGAVSLPSRGAFHLSLTVLVHYRSQGSVQAWMVVHPASDRVPRARPYSGAASAVWDRRSVRGPNPLRPALPGRSGRRPPSAPGAGAPGRAALQPRRRLVPRPWRRSPVWPSSPFARRYSGNLVIDFSSSGYLDVSVPRVAPSEAMCSPRRRRTCVRRVRPFGDPGIEGRVRLPRDYRGLPRPSSAPCAKASAVRPWYLPARPARGPMDDRMSYRYCL